MARFTGADHGDQPPFIHVIYERDVSQWCLPSVQRTTSPLHLEKQSHRSQIYLLVVDVTFVFVEICTLKESGLANARLSSSFLHYFILLFFFFFVCILRCALIAIRTHFDRFRVRRLILRTRLTRARQRVSLCSV